MFKLFLLTMAAIGGLSSLGVAPAAADTCIDLYVQRNQIYSDVGYCFKTRQALQYFSNANCIPGDPRLSSRQRERVADIQAQERRNNCRTQ